MADKLTLDEMAQLAEKVTSWEEINEKNFYGKVNETLRISCSKTTDFPFWWRKTAHISIFSYSDESNPYVHFGHYYGKQVYPIYQRIRELARPSVEKKEQEEQIKTNQRIEEVRKKYLGGSE